MAPLFSAELELQAPEMVFQPALGLGQPDGFLKIIDNMLADIYKMSTLVPRICHAEFTDYSVCKTLKENHRSTSFLILNFMLIKADMEDMEELNVMRSDLISRVQEAMDKAISYSQEFLEYAHLWTDDRQVFVMLGNVLRSVFHLCLFRNSCYNF